jgi:hypothetical protein
LFFDDFWILNIWIFRTLANAWLPNLFLKKSIIEITSHKPKTSQTLTNKLLQKHNFCNWNFYFPTQKCNQTSKEKKTFFIIYLWPYLSNKRIHKFLFNHLFFAKIRDFFVDFYLIKKNIGNFYRVANNSRSKIKSIIFARE